MKIYHQCGHNSVWNKRAVEELGAGVGLIFSPVHDDFNRLTNYPPSLRQSSFLDPQFYLPNSQKQKLNTYPFFPEVLSGGFSTQDFNLRALEAARLCVDFQVEQNYDRIVIPARYHDQMIRDYCDAQSVYSVDPFLQALSGVDSEKDIFLTLPITSHMASDANFRNEILNWVTGYPEVDGIYLIIATERSTKQITDSVALFSNLEFISLLKDAGLKIIIGYTNSETLLYSLVGDVELTFGAYENTRMFSLDKFIERADSPRGPRSRIYLPGLFNWIQLEQAKDIRSDAASVWDQIYIGTEDSEAALNSTVPWHFGKPELYLHHFENVQTQVTQLAALNRQERYELLRANLLSARNFYSNIQSQRIDLEQHGNGDHITPWLDAINRYSRRYLE